MALSIEEERILSEIASRLSEDDPALANRLGGFGRARRRRRIRAMAALVVAIVVITALLGAAFITVPA